jgi:hypothetical protein
MTLQESRTCLSSEIERRWGDGRNIVSLPVHACIVHIRYIYIVKVYWPDLSR